MPGTEAAPSSAFHLPASEWQVDDEAGTFEGFLAVFNTPDAEGDIVEPGAFEETLQQPGPSGHPPGRRPVLWQHNPREPIGVAEFERRERGLWMRGELNDTSQRAREAHSLLEQGAISGLSQGFDTLESERRTDADGRRLQKLTLWEGSLVTFPSQREAQVAEVKEAHARVAWPSERRAFEAQPRQWLENQLEEMGVLDADEGEEPSEENDQDEQLRELRDALDESTLYEAA